MPKPAGQTIIVVPCYNEARRLPARAFLAYAAACRHTSFVMVDDGSRDGTRQVLESLERRCPQGFKVLCLARNSGKAEAVRRGMLLALEYAPRLVGYWDADLSAPLEQVDRLAAVFDSRPGVEVVLGSRVSLMGYSIRRRSSRHYLGRAAATLISMVSGLAIYDTQCGAKLFAATPDLERALSRPFLARWLFDVELLLRLALQWHTQGRGPAEKLIFELPLERWWHKEGSKVSPLDFLRALGEIYRLHRRYPRG